MLGVDEKLLSPNIYGKNVEKDISENNKKVIDTVSLKSFAAHSNTREVTLLQTSSASDERSYIEASSDPELYTLENNFVFPFAAMKEYSRIPVAASSIFGLNRGRFCNWHSSPSKCLWFGC